MLSSTTSDMASLVAERAIPPPPPKATRCRKMYLAAFAALLFAVAMGMAGAYSATATADMQKSSSRVIPTDEEVSWIGSLVALGAFFGGIIAGYMSNKLGRKGALIISSVPFLAGWLIIAYSPNVWMIYFGRFVTGICVGLVCTTTPAYLVEISTPEVRGLLGTSFQLFVVIGVLIVNTLGSFISWNWLAIASSVSVVFALLLMCFMPESPRWLVVNGYYRAAIDAVKWLQGPSFDADAECVAINEDICLQPKGGIKCREFSKPLFYKPALLSIGLVFFQQFCGSNAILFYTVAIFKDSKSSLKANDSTIVVDAVLVIATAISSLIIDKVGRKVLLLISGIGMATSLFALGGYEYAKLSNFSLASQYSWVPLVCIVVYIATFSLGYGPVTWLMIPEMSPVRVRSLIGGAATALCWGFVFIITKTFETLLKYMCDYGTYWFYAGFCVLSCVFAALCLPETKGKQFDEIQEYFISNKVKRNPTAPE